MMGSLSALGFLCIQSKNPSSISAKLREENQSVIVADRGNDIG